MSKANVPEEVEVLSFFEKAPIEKAELLFNIVKEKMRGRLAEDDVSEKPKKKQHAAPKEAREAPQEDEATIPSQQI
jgi:hypothetical protein